MRDRKLDRLFDRFRHKGDTSALARVFDATAPELLGLATHLVRDVGEGEDLLQQTFLTAIEKADRYDADRRLVPWLVGILVRHAHEARRRRSRPEGEPLPELVGGEDPEGSAEESELTDSVKDALGRLPASYRDVLEPYLLHGERAVDIARSCGKSPGTVRVQIRRGLDELRRTLPAGLAAGSGVLLGGRTLADVRGAVLEHASRISAHGTATGVTAVTSTSLVSSSSLLGGLVMSTKFAIVAFALSLLTLFGWLVQRDGTSDLRALVDASGSLGPIPSTSPIAAGIPIDSSTTSTEASTETERVAESTIEANPSGLEAALAGAGGRVIDEYGNSVAGITVQLLEIRSSMFENLVSTPFDGDLARGLRALARNPVVATDETDAEGRFDFWGADPQGAHGIGIDLGGDRPALRFIDQELTTGESGDLGTIQLEASRTLRGRVVDSKGRPVVGSRVRAGDFPDEMHGLAAIRQGGTVLSSDRGGFVLEVPTWLDAWIDLLPIPSTQTDGQGRFELNGVGTSVASLFVDHPRHGVIISPIWSDLADLEDIAFPAPKRYRGRVVDSTGSAVTEAEVMFGAALFIRRSPDDNGVVWGDLSSAADGSFEFEVSGSPMVAARRGVDHEWLVVSDFDDGGEITLNSDLDVQFELRDREGSVITGAELHLSPFAKASKLITLLQSDMRRGDVTEEAPGKFTVRALVEGDYRVRAQAKGFAILDRVLQVAEDGDSFELVLDRAGTRRVQVVDLDDRSPVSGARVTIQDQNLGQSVIAVGSTDEAGYVVLSGVPAEGEHDLALRVTHPAYADSLDGYETREPETRTVELASGTQANFQVTVGGAAPLEPLMISIHPDEATGSFMSLPTTGLTDLRGSATFSQLPAGEWSYTVTTRFLNTDVKNLITAGQPEILASGTFSVAPGATEEIHVELAADDIEESHASESAGIMGRIMVEGVVPTGLQVGAVPMEGNQASELSLLPVLPGGEYRIDGLRPGKHTLYVGCGSLERGDFGVIAMPRVDIRPGRVTRKDIHLKGSTFEISLVDAAGEPVRDGDFHASLMLDGPSNNPYSRRSGEGVYTVTVWETGEYKLWATSPTEGSATRIVEFLGTPNERYELILSRGVPCAGEIELPEGDYPSEGQLFFSQGGRRLFNRSVPVTFTDGRATFEMIGLHPGNYHGGVHFLETGEVLHLALVLPESGDTNLQLLLSTELPEPAPGFDFRPVNSDE